MTPGQLEDFYRGYIDCLNRQDWPRLGDFVHDAVAHNDRPLGLAGYRAMLEGDFRAIPDLRFTIALLVAQPPTSPAACTSTAPRSASSSASP